MSENAPLVSVVVVTYNSAKTVVETLDSISQQTYKNIELIVSDDASQDGTVEIVSKWVEEHKDDFVGSRVISAERNTGTVKNLNRGIRASNGFWIKSIAGDDCLEPFAVERYLAFIKSNPSCRMIMSDLKLFSDNSDVPQKEISNYNYFIDKASESLEEQKNRVVKELVFTGPSWFYSRSLWDDVGGFDEDYILMEEWPFVYNVLMSNNRIFVQHEKLVRYRISNTSVCRNREDKLMNKTLFLDLRRFFYKVRLFQYLKKMYIINIVKIVIKTERYYLGYF